MSARPLHYSLMIAHPDFHFSTIPRTPDLNKEEEKTIYLFFPGKNPKDIRKQSNSEIIFWQEIYQAWHVKLDRWLDNLYMFETFVPLLRKKLDEIISRYTLTICQPSFHICISRQQIKFLSSFNPSVGRTNTKINSYELDSPGSKL